jgi:23S rRNA (uracil1939-C5)-methyltransferase
VELRAGRIVACGDALAHAPDGRVALIDGALPGERVRVEITAQRSDHMRARVVEVLDPSPARVGEPCPFARAGCGGCTWQHIRVDAQRAYKRDIIVDALRRIARCSEPPLRDTVSLPDFGYRTTVRVLVVDGRPAFRRRHAHEPARIEYCPIAHPLVDDVLRHGRFDGAREVTIRVGARTGERSMLADPPDAALQVADDIARGRNASIHEEVAGQRFRVSTRSFFQVRADGADALAVLVRDAVGPDRRVADLYCGVGLFAGVIERPRSVVVAERGRSAVADARVNLEGGAARVVRADVGRWRGTEVDVVIADPSRAGLQREGAATVLRCAPERVVLVSCDAAAFARDVMLLEELGFTLTSVTPVDLFPHTPHVECVSVLDR